MALPRFAWGIDVGNTALKAVRVAREGGQVRITDFEVIEHDQILSNSGDNRPDLMKKTLAEFVQRRNIKGSVVAVSVSGQQSFARFIKLPPVEPKKIPEIVRFEAVQQIPFPLSDVEWSYQLFRDEQSPDVEVGIFAMRRELVNNYMSYFTDVDLNVQVVQMNSLAVYNALYHDDRFQGTTMAIDMGAETTDLVIADGETVWLRSIPIGGNNFTESLVKSFKLNFAKAEELKRNAATSKYARQIFQAMRPVFADLANEIQRSIGFYASVHRDSRLERIVALGGTFKLPGLQKYLQQNLQLNIERLDGLSAGAPADPKQAAQFSDHLLSMVTAYGLGLQALGEGKISSSLLPASIQRAKLWKEKTKWFAAAAAGFVFAPAVAYGALQLINKVPYESSSARDARARVDSAKSTAEGLDRSWTAIQQSGQEDRTLVENVESLLKYRNFWPNLLTDIYVALPKPQWDSSVIDPKEMKSTPRELRNQIVIESITPRFIADVAPLLNMSEDNFRKSAANYVGPQPTSNTSGGGMANMGMMPPGAMAPGMMPPGAMAPGMMPPGAMAPGMMPPGAMAPGMMPGMGMAPGAGGAEVADNPNAKRGFVVTITGTTPNQLGHEMIQKWVVEKLGSLDIKSIGQSRGYYIARVSLGDARKFSVSQQRLQRVAQVNQAAAAAKAAAEGTVAPTGGNAYPGAAMGMPGGFNPAGNTGTNNTQQYLDPLTGESVLNDTEFTLYLVVVVDPSKADIDAAMNPTAAGPNASAAAPAGPR